jgi:hypothetical protein
MKPVKSSFVKTLTALMAERGYATMAVFMPMQTVYAFEKAINSEMHCYAYFRYMAARKAYDVTLGVESVQLQPAVDEALEKFSLLAGGLAYTAATSPTTRLLFNADVFTKPTVGETLPAKVELVQPYLDALFTSAVQPIFEAVSDREQLLRLLLRTDPPFDRMFFSRRLLFIAKLARVTQSDWAPIRASLQDIERFLRNDAYIEKYPGPLIDDAYAYFGKSGSDTD